MESKEMEIADAVIRTPEIVAAEINGIKEQTRKMVLVNAIEIGKRLAEAKEMVPFGSWGKWLEESVDYSQSTATNLINVFEAYSKEQGSIFGAEAKSQTFANLSYSQAVTLLALPDEEREAFAEDNDVEHLSVRETKKLIDEKLQLEKEKEKFRTDAVEALEEVGSLQQALQSAEEKLAKAKNNTKDKDKIVQLQSDLQSAREELDRLKDDNETPKVIEKIPDAVQEELETLRGKACQTVGVIEYKTQVSIITGAVQRLIEMSTTDEKRQKALITVLESELEMVREQFGKVAEDEDN